MDLLWRAEEIPLWPVQVLFLNSSLERVSVLETRNGLCPTLILGPWAEVPLASSFRLSVHAGRRPSQVCFYLGGVFPVLPLWCHIPLPLRPAVSNGTPGG